MQVQPRRALNRPDSIRTGVDWDESKHDDLSDLFTGTIPRVSRIEGFGCELELASVCHGPAHPVEDTQRSSLLSMIQYRPVSELHYLIAHLAITGEVEDAVPPPIVYVPVLFASLRVGEDEYVRCLG